MDLREKLYFYITNYGLQDRRTIEASKRLDKQLAEEQLQLNRLKEKGYLDLMVNEVRVGKRIEEILDIADRAERLS